MTVRSVVRCDAPGCGRVVSDAAPGASWWTRLTAESVGWHTGDDGDYCPQHAESGEDS